MNRVFLIGRLTKDPELRKTSGDISVCQFKIAVDRNYNASGEKQTDFINCVAWRNQAENLCKYIRKGGLVAVEGTLQSRTYVDQNGVSRYVLDVVCSLITFLETRRAASGYDDLSQLEPPTNFGGYRTNNFNQSSRRSDYQNNPQEEMPENENEKEDQEKPFADIDSNITGDDLPF